MSLTRAKKKYREFHLRAPNRITRLKTAIPRYVYPIGYAIQISYRSDKWNNDGRWVDYIHWWENPTLVCMGKSSKFPKINGMKFDLGRERNEVTFLGHAIDFSMADEDRCDIDISDNEVYNGMEGNSGEMERIRDTLAIPFSTQPGRSGDYVVCSPRGNVVHIISEDSGDVYSFINNRCRVTGHGIEG